MLKKALAVILGVFIVLYLNHSYDQYILMSLDGDVADNVVPGRDYQQVLKDPIGWEAVVHGKKSAGVNRFFAHWSMYVYMRKAPLFLQHFFSPVDSVYVAAAVFRLLTHVLLLYLLGVYITRTFNPFRFDFLLAVALMVPFFQVNDYAIYMGIIHHSITYTFFYSFALCQILLFFLPFYLVLRSEKKFSFIVKILLFGGAFVLAFNGPLVPPVCVLLILLIFFHGVRPLLRSEAGTFAHKMFRNIRSLPGSFLFYFVLLGLLSAYSLYLGTYNTDSYVGTIPLWERYSRLPEGIYNMVTQKLGFPLLFLAIAINVFLIRKFVDKEDGKSILIAIRYIGAFALVYILLLPLGGYRVYRPNILRHDTVMPITVALIFFYGLSSTFILKKFTGNRLKIYAGACVVFAFIYAWADKDISPENVCEKAAIEKIANSDKDTIRVDSSCTVIAWTKIPYPADSKLNAELLRYWRVINKKKLYYQ